MTYRYFLTARLRLSAVKFVMCQVAAPNCSNGKRVSAAICLSTLAASMKLTANRCAAGWAAHHAAGQQGERRGRLQALRRRVRLRRRRQGRQVRHQLPGRRLPVRAPHRPRPRGVPSAYVLSFQQHCCQHAVFFACYLRSKEFSALDKFRMSLTNRRPLCQQCY